LVCAVAWRFASPSFFKGETLNRSTPTLVPEGVGMPLVPSGDAARQTGSDFGGPAQVRADP